jgi:hypothetical protein
MAHIDPNDQGVLGGEDLCYVNNTLVPPALSRDEEGHAGRVLCLAVECDRAEASETEGLVLCCTESDIFQEDEQKG